MRMEFLMRTVRTLVVDVHSLTRKAQLLLGVRLRHPGGCNSNYLPDPTLRTRRLSLGHHFRMGDFSWMENQEAARGTTGDMSLDLHIHTETVTQTDMPLEYHRLSSGGL